MKPARTRRAPTTPTTPTAATGTNGTATPTYTGNYILRGIDPQLWRRVKGKAALEGMTMKAAIETLLREWVGHP